VIHGVVLGHLLRVYDFATEEMPFSSPENSAQLLEGLVERKKLRSIPAALTLSGPGVVHRLLDLPPMPHGELDLVVEREMRTIGEAGSEDIVFDWEVVGESGSRNLKQLRVLVAMASRSQVASAQRLLAQCRLKPALFTTPPVSLLRVLRFLQGEKSGLQTVLYVGEQQGYLLGVQDGIWSFYREFSSRSLEEGTSTLSDEAVKEANRVFLYHRHGQGDAKEIAFILCGQEGLEEIRTRLERETGIQGEIVQPGAGLDLSPLEEKKDIFHTVFPSFIIPLGLVAASYVPKGINLAPKAVLNLGWSLSRIDFSFVRRPVVGLIVLLAFLGLHPVLLRTERQYQRLLEERVALYSAWVPAIKAAEESEGLRNSEKLLAQSLGTSRIAEVDWVQLFKALSRLSQPDLVLQSMSVQREKERWLITLKGEVVSRDAYTAHVVFNRFYQGLKSSAYLEQLELLPLNVTTFAEKVDDPTKKVPGGSARSMNVEPQAGGAEVKKTRVEFEIRGQAREI
jgi:Tfp pilus assembly PilM family ATPase